VLSFDREDFLGYLEDFYAPDNMIVSAAGNVCHDDIVQRISKLFGDRTRRMRRLRRRIPLFHTEQAIVHKDCEQTHVCYGGRGIAQNDDDKYLVMLIDSMLGGSVSSMLFQEIREKRGLAYSVSSFQSSYFNCGLLGVYAGTSNRNLPKVLKLVRGILKKMRDGDIRKKDFNRAKEHLKTAISLALESTSNRMMRLAKSEIYHGRLIPHQEVFEKIDAVTLPRLVEAAGKYLDDSQFSLAVLGPTKGVFEGTL
jgi:predicted Zn-dependent peptidase